MLLESEWVLRAAYGLPAPRIAELLTGLLGLPGVCTAEPQGVATALKACASGLDFADALHIAPAVDAEAFYTFDAALRRRAAKAMPGSSVLPP